MENGKNRLQQIQEDVEEITVILEDNLNMADERNGQLGELEDRADVLLEKSKAFERTTAQLRPENRWENVVLIAVCVVVAIIIGLKIYAKFNKFL
ncbi:vamp5 [Pungitius sinensis]